MQRLSGGLEKKTHKKLYEKREVFSWNLLLIRRFMKVSKRIQTNVRDAVLFVF